MRTLRLAGTILRLTRLVTTDTITEWALLEHLRRRAYAREQRVGNDDPDDPVTWPARLLSAVDCPFCIGFWIALVVITLDEALPQSGAARRAWHTLSTALAANYVLAHTAARLDG